MDNDKLLMKKLLKYTLLSFVTLVYIQTMDAFQIQVDYQMHEADAATITKGLGEFNAPFLGPEKSLAFALYLRDEHHQIVGGVLAWMKPGIQLLCIDTVWVTEGLRKRGLGKQLMQAAENEGRKNGCTHAQLETLPFQAEDFYKKLGYVQIGRIEKFYGDYDAIYLRKYLIPLNE